MDFGQLLHTAQKNEKLNKNGARYYSTKFEPPKKEKKGKELSDNIKKFLARKEAEEKVKAEHEKKKKEELLALRAQDKKATRRVNVMLKRTKSANQSVIQDAVDNDNTAVTLAGPMQPDEDDYGYVSQEASAFYNKMMEKYSKMPDEPKFDLTKKKVSTNLSSTKDRVKAALEREKEEAMQPHRRKRKHKEHKDDAEEEGISYGQPDRPERHESPPLQQQQPPPPKKHKPAPPPMNFADLLKIAEKKQFEPIIIEKKEKEDEKLFTKKQRKEMEREREYLQRKEARKLAESKGLPVPTTSNSIKIPKIGEKSSKIPGIEKTDKVRTGEQKLSSDGRIPKLNSASQSNAKPSGQLNSKPSFQPSTKPSVSNPKEVFKKPSTSSSLDRSTLEKNRHGSANSLPPKTNKPLSSKPTNRDQENYKHSINSTNLSKDKVKPMVKEKMPSKDIPSTKSPPEEAPTRKYLPGDVRYKPPPEEVPTRKYLPGDIRYKPPQEEAPTKKYLPGDIRYKPSTDTRPKQLPTTEVKSKIDPKLKQVPSREMKPKQFPPNDLKPKQFPPKDLKPKQFPPPDVRRPQPPLKKQPMMVKKGRILDDDDSEYDSEMGDFIDDDDAGEDYSKYINEIFGYDKNRYRDVDDDIDNMESTFAQQMKEEVISKKIAIQEDLEELRKEKEEEKRKALMKKRKN